MKQVRTLLSLSIIWFQTLEKQQKKHWPDSIKSLFALILDYGGPALANQIRERIGGPS